MLIVRGPGTITAKDQVFVKCSDAVLHAVLSSQMQAPGLVSLTGHANEDERRMRSCLPAYLSHV